MFLCLYLSFVVIFKHMSIFRTGYSEDTPIMVITPPNHFINKNQNNSIQVTQFHIELDI